MGWFNWFADDSETKIEQEGGISNIVTIGEPITLNEKELIIMIFIICIIKIIELC
jgi:hypothetical protein